MACLVLDPVTLEVIPGSEFMTYMRPDDLNTVDNTPEKQRALSINGITRDKLANAPVWKVGFQAFASHLKRVVPSGGKPYAVGKNIRNFDLPITNRVCRQLGLTTPGGNNQLFDHRWNFQIEDFAMPWLLWPGLVDSISMDALRAFFGMSQEKSHDALFDVRQTAWLFRKFVKFITAKASTVRFANAAAADGGLLHAS